MCVWTGTIRPSNIPLAAALLALTSCGGGSEMNAGSMQTADFESIQANIFTPICSGCHSGAAASANLQLDAAHSFNDLVNVPSTEVPTIVRVKPGDPDNSYLVIHLQKDGDGATEEDISLVIQWVMNGAPPG
jgi:mono/diheme cytochrome c family protein